MAWSVDARIPIFVLPDAAALTAALAAGRPAVVVGSPAGSGEPVDVAFEASALRHVAACLCCQGRSPAAQALEQLFQARARGTRPWFDRVLVLPEGGAEAEIRAALRDDSIASARFRLA